jgi:hypothetical protein
MVIFLIAGAVLLGAGCRSAPSMKTREVTLALEVGKTKTTFNIKVGDLVTLELPPVDAPGFGWQVFMKDGRYLKQTTEVVPPKSAGGGATVKFLAMLSTERASNNRTTVRFLLIKQDGSKESQPIDGHDAIFTIE